MKEKYRYFGNGEILSNYAHFHKFGQELALTDPQAYDCAKVGGILKSEDFLAVGWTPMEKSNKNERRGPAFDARLKIAMEKRTVLLEELAARLAAPPPDSVEGE
jgi:hypothetical protein